MSNRGTDNLIEHIIDRVDALWQLPNRDDLKNDCIKYVALIIERRLELSLNGYVKLGLGIKDLMISFLSMKCADAMSEADLESMARAEEESKVSSYQEADQGV